MYQTRVLHLLLQICYKDQYNKEKGKGFDSYKDSLQMKHLRALPDMISDVSLKMISATFVSLYNEVVGTVAVSTFRCKTYTKMLPTSLNIFLASVQARPHRVQRETDWGWRHSMDELLQTSTKVYQRGEWPRVQCLFADATYTVVRQLIPGVCVDRPTCAYRTEKRPISMPAPLPPQQVAIGDHCLLCSLNMEKAAARSWSIGSSQTSSTNMSNKSRKISATKSNLIINPNGCFSLKAAKFVKWSVCMETWLFLEALIFSPSLEIIKSLF